MAKDLPPAFLLYARDLLTSRKVLLMTPEERGGYLFLLCHAWLADKQGVLLNDDGLLAALSGLGARWPECRERILAAFVVKQNGTIVQPRMVAERKAQRNRSAQAKKGADITNAKRWGNVAGRLA